MKKTQKVIDALMYIDNLDLSNEELERLEDEINSLQSFDLIRTHYFLNNEEWNRIT